jgi:two-component system chemotaxis sensor kinase CheA
MSDAFSTLSSEEIRLFWEEATELLHAVEQEALTALDDPNAGDVALAFRAVHTLKGMGAMMGLEDWANRAHSLETRLDRVRQGMDALDAAAPAMLELVDALSRHRMTPPDGVGDGAVLIVTLSPDSVFPGARVVQVTETVRAYGAITAVAPPEEEWDQFQGREVVLTLSSETDLEAARAAVAVLEDVVAVSIGTPGPSDPPVSPETGDRQSGVPRRTTESVRVPVEVLDRILEGIGELVVNRTQAQHVVQTATIPGEAKALYSTLNENMARTTIHLQDLVMRTRMLPLEVLFRQYPRVVHDLGAKLGKALRLVVEGQDTELDRAVIDSIGEPLLHLIRNACDHGIETPEGRRAAGKLEEGRITVRAQPLAGHVRIEVADDGAGINWEHLRAKAVQEGWWEASHAETATPDELTSLLFRPGVSTAAQVTDISGRGVGLDVVETVMTALHGSVSVRSTEGAGTVFELVLPLTMAIMRALLVQVGTEVYAVPLGNVERVDAIDTSGFQAVLGTGLAADPDGALRPVLDLQRWWLGDAVEVTSDHIIRLKDGSISVAMAVREVLGEEEIVVKTLGYFSSLTPEYTGATVLSDGRLALVLDVRRVVQKWQRERARTEELWRDGTSRRELAPALDGL